MLDWGPLVPGYRSDSRFSGMLGAEGRLPWVEKSMGRGEERQRQRSTSISRKLLEGQQPGTQPPNIED